MSVGFLLVDEHEEDEHAAGGSQACGQEYRDCADDSVSSRLFGIGDDRDDERSDEAYEVDDDEDVPDPARRVEVDAEQLGHERAQKGKDGQCEAGAAAPCPPAVRRCRRICRLLVWVLGCVCHGHCSLDVRFTVPVNWSPVT